jgi:hypothetical protein
MKLKKRVPKSRDRETIPLMSALFVVCWLVYYKLLFAEPTN